MKLDETMSASRVIRVIQYGLGPIGSAVARLAAGRAGLELVGGVDIDPAKIGRDLAEVIGLDQPAGIPVSGSLSEVLERRAADVVLHTTSSYFDLFHEQLLEIVEAGLSVVSTAEELAFPWRDHPELARALDAAARQGGSTVLGTGVNPGFLMDTLPLTLTAICQEVEHIAVSRVINASERRGPFQAKIGAGMSVDAFMDKMRQGRMGHVGLPESMAMLFDTLGRTLAHYEDSVEPVVADRVTQSEHFTVQPGQVIGLHQVARGYTGEGEFGLLTFHAALDLAGSEDTITITGKPTLTVRLQGTQGDLATAAIAVNAVRRVYEAPPGLMTMRDLPVVTAW